MNRKPPRSFREESPSVLLATLFSARKSGDETLAQLMTDRLVALGITITFTSRSPAVEQRKGGQR